MCVSVVMDPFVPERAIEIARAITDGNCDFVIVGCWHGGMDMSCGREAVEELRQALLVVGKCRLGEDLSQAPSIAVYPVESRVAVAARYTSRVPGKCKLWRPDVPSLWLGGSQTHRTLEAMARRRGKHRQNAKLQTSLAAAAASWVRPAVAGPPTGRKKTTNKSSRNEPRGRGLKREWDSDADDVPPPWRAEP